MAANRLKASKKCLWLKCLWLPGGHRVACLRVMLVALCFAYGTLAGVSGGLSTAYAAGSTLVLQSNLPQWPEEFGEPHTVARAARWPGYKSVIGPDSTVWCITLSAPDPSHQKQGGFVLTRADKDMAVLSTSEIQPVQGDVVAFDVAVLDECALIFWAEKRGDDYFIHLKQIRSNPERPESPVLSGTWTFSEVPSVVQDVAVAVSGDKVFFGWVDQEEGRPGAFIAQLDAGIFGGGPDGAPPGSEVRVQNALAHLPKVRISDRDISVTSISLVPAPGGVWVAWVQSGQILNRIMLSPYLDGELKPPIEVMQTGSAGLRGVAPLIADDGVCHLVFARGRVHQGTVRRPTVVYGILDSDGNWLMQPVSITQGEGEASGPSAVLDDGTIAIAWSDNRSGKFQIHYGLVKRAQATEPGSQVTLMSYGAATLSSKECFFPEMLVFDDGTRAILYQVYLAGGDMLVQGVSSRNPVKPGWVYYLGLDLENPAQDGLFKLVTVLGASLLFTLLALPSLAVGVALILVADRLNIFSETPTGANLRSLFLFGVVFLMKKPGVWYYAYAPVLPSGLSWLSFWLASIAVICVDSPFGSYKKDVLSTALSGVLYIFFDNVFSTILKGVGLV
jgi:hypothetical protein